MAESTEENIGNIQNGSLPPDQDSEYHAEVVCDDREMSYRFSAHLHLGHIHV